MRYLELIGPTATTFARHLGLLAESEADRVPHLLHMTGIRRFATEPHKCVHLRVVFFLRFAAWTLDITVIMRICTSIGTALAVVFVEEVMQDRFVGIVIDHLRHSDHEEQQARQYHPRHYLVEKDTMQ